MKYWQVSAVLVLALVALRQIGEVDKLDEFEDWKVQFGMRFEAEEEAFRRMTFMRNLEEINRHNADSKQSYKKGVNQFTHLIQGEFEQMFLSTFYRHSQSSKVAMEDFVMPNAEVDWNSQGMVSPVKNQGLCDAGYAFCSSSLIESFYRFAQQNLTLSEQQIVDCS
jgi:hypothetical protein